MPQRRKPDTLFAGAFPEEKTAAKIKIKRRTENPGSGTQE